MTLRELKQLVDLNLEHLQDYQNPRVVVEVKGSGIGGTPCVDVVHGMLGFDWDSGKFILSTECKLKRE